MRGAQAHLAVDGGGGEALHALVQNEAADGADGAAFAHFFGPDHEHVGHRAVGDPHLAALELVTAIDLVGARGHAAGVRAVVGLGQAEAADEFTAGQLGQVFLLLRLGAEFVDGHHHQRALHAGHGAVARVHALDLAGHQAVADVVQAGAAVLRGDGGAQQAQLAHLAEDGQEDRPVAIGRLQRHAVDALMESDRPQVFTRAPETGKRVAVVGAGPAGLACAYTLARQGHSVALFDARPKIGGLNEYGLASYKTPDDFAQREVQWLLAIGGITVHHGWKLETTAQLDTLRRDHGAVFLGMGLSATHVLGIPGERLNGVRPAVDFIAELRQCADVSTLPVGRRVVIIGGGMTAVDAAVQSKLLGAETVHMVYRRGPEGLSASQAEQEWAQKHDVRLHYWLAPQEIVGTLDLANPTATDAGHVCAVRFARQSLVDGKVTPTGETEVLQADMVLKAIGQQLGNPLLQQAGFALQDGRIATDAEGQTNLSGVWAGGDCRYGAPDLTVEAVEHGKQSAHAIHAYLVET
jgi:dihydropyrimidine dehydrogenase (NAD+) subunit PreT